MKLSIITGAILSTLAITGLVSCSSGSDTSATDTSGSTVVGTIAGFGSIIMDNGVEYETDGLSDCEVDDMVVAGVCEDSLYTGMHVTLQTDANGAVTSLKYDDELEGAVTSGSVTGDKGDYSFDVFGVTVITSSGNTQWDDFTITPPSIAELDGANIEISGEWQQDGSLLASYVEKQDDSEHEVEGTVGTINGTGFPLILKSGGTIDVDGSALSLLPAVGDFVELEGSYIAGVFIATSSEIEDEDDFYSDSEAEITGILSTNSDSPTGFSIANTDVDISNASTCSGLTGLLVEAEGNYDADTGILVVRECEDEDEDMEVKCMVSNNAIIPDETKPKVGSVECGFTGTSGGPLTIKFNDTPDMAMFSGDSTASTFDLTDVLSGDCVEIKFSKDANGDYIAGLIEIEDKGTGCSSYELEGTLDSFNDNSDITVLGVTFTVNPGTTYDPDKTGLVAGVSVSIKDNGADGTADEVEVD
ncbi:MAG: hypothetical protein KJN89_07355 [Gammaproteobacteria bacterium]|nr:hypothetical protein [Gammaproteobacteria bacterium]NNJ50179.1 hypothetical protein [Gammaproteobacteria bacterium]